MGITSVILSFALFSLFVTTSQLTLMTPPKEMRRACAQLSRQAGSKASSRKQGKRNADCAVCTWSLSTDIDRRDRYRGEKIDSFQAVSST